MSQVQNIRDSKFFYFEKEVDCPSCSEGIASLDCKKPKIVAMGVGITYKCNSCKNRCVMFDYDYEMAKKDKNNALKTKRFIIINTPAHTH